MKTVWIVYEWHEWGRTDEVYGVYASEAKAREIMEEQKIQKPDALRVEETTVEE